MASSFTLKSISYDGRFLETYLTQSPSIEKNKSVIKYTITSKGGNHDYYSTGPTTLRAAGSDRYYCAFKSYSTHQFPAARGSVSGSFEVEHDNDGKKSITVSIATAIYNSTVETRSGDWQLDDIPRKAEITSAPDFSDADSPTINYKNPLGNSADSLTACIEVDNEIEIPYRNIDKTGKSYTFNFTSTELNILRHLATGKGGKRAVKFVVRTQIGSTVFWSISEKTFTVKETEGSKPSVSVRTEPVSELAEPFNSLYIQGKSKIKVIFTAEGKYGAGIEAYKAGGVGISASGNPAVSDILRYDGLLEVKGTVTDSRGFTNYDTAEIDVLPYKEPYIAPYKGMSDIVCARCTSGGEISGSGIYLKIKCRREYSPVMSGEEQNNFCSLQYRVKKASAPDTAYSDWKIFTAEETETNDIEAVIAGAVEQATVSYVVQIRAQDRLGASLPVSFAIPTEKVTLHLPKGGNGAGFGKYCEKDGYMEIAYKVEIDKEELKDFVTEYGEKDGWSYRKWKSGKAECYRREEITVSIQNKWGTLYVSEEKTGWSFPFEFAETPLVTMSLARGGYMGILAQTQATKTYSGGYEIARPDNAAADVKFIISCTAAGKWK